MTLHKCLAGIMAVMLMSACQSSIDVEKEKAAIKGVVQKSSKAWLDRDLESMSSVWAHEEHSARIGASRGSYGIGEGWNALEERYTNLFENNPEPSQNTEYFSNYRIKVYPGSATVILDNEVKSPEGETVNKSIHTYIMEKVDNQWKIAVLSSVSVVSYEWATRNLETSSIYHKLDPNDIDRILTDDFIGRSEHDRNTWTKEQHRNFWTNNKGMAVDTVYRQLAIGNWVATMFERRMKWQGRDVEAQAMHFKRFENEKIAEIWEFGDSRQLD